MCSNNSNCELFISINIRVINRHRSSTLIATEVLNICSLKCVCVPQQMANYYHFDFDEWRNRQIQVEHWESTSTNNKRTQNGTMPLSIYLLRIACVFVPFLEKKWNIWWTARKLNKRGGHWSQSKLLSGVWAFSFPLELVCELKKIVDNNEIALFMYAIEAGYILAEVGLSSWEEEIDEGTFFLHYAPVSRV